MLQRAFPIVNKGDFDYYKWENKLLNTEVEIEEYCSWKYNPYMKTAVITGASTGIGRAIAYRLAEDGFHTILVARSEGGLSKTKALIQSAGGSSEVISADLSTIETIDDLVRKIQISHQQVDVLVNVAGIWHGKDIVFADTQFQDFDKKTIIDTIHVGTLAPLLLVHGLVPSMPSRSKIVNISGTFSSGAKGWLPYYVSKRAIEDLTVGLAEELMEKRYSGQLYITIRCRNRSVQKVLSRI
ncbi:MAG: Fatty acyl-CoA reductase [Microgenomates bacterium OLB22]|nr:MAG: Fatty acyl-CoA reductase [Microgenomates bacterium OLB22]